MNTTRQKNTSKPATINVKLYFDANYTCIGGYADNWEIPNYSGEYYYTNSVQLPYGVNPAGKNEIYFLLKCRHYTLMPKPAGATPVLKSTATENPQNQETMTLDKISVRLYFNEANICLGGLALEVYSEKFSFSGDYYASEDVQIYPSQDVQGKTWPTINKERVKVWYEALKAKNA